MKLRPTEDRLVLLPLEQEDVTTGGILLPETAKERPQQATVIAAGPGRTGDRGKLMPMEVRAGDRVLYSKYAGTEFKHEGTTLLILRESDLLAIVE